MKNGLVSIIIPCYNASKYLNKCLDSLLNQTYKNIEVIIVNDGSTDESKLIIESYIDKFSKKKKKLIIINQENAGQAVAVNNALKKVSGEYFMWQDADDWYELDAVENLVNFLKKENLNVARGEAFYRNDTDINTVFYHAKSITPNDYNVFDKYLYEYDCYNFSGIFICKMSHFDSCIKNREIYTSRAGQNWQLILPITYREKCGYLDKVVYNYRIVESSHSHSVKKMKDLLKRCDMHKDIIFNVLDSINRLDTTSKKKYKNKLRIKYCKKKIGIIVKKILFWR